MAFHRLVQNISSMNDGLFSCFQWKIAERGREHENKNQQHPGHLETRDITVNGGESKNSSSIGHDCRGGAQKSQVANRHWAPAKCDRQTRWSAFRGEKINYSISGGAKSRNHAPSGGTSDAAGVTRVYRFIVPVSFAFGRSLVVRSGVLSSR